jgi:4-hydroxybenzoate polyprenyltransferase
VYLWRLTRLAVVEVVMLAGLLTLRIAGGYAATGIACSWSLLVVSFVAFAGLGSVKRLDP